jgi:hypothetical protein
MYQEERWAVAEHSTESGRWIKFQETEVLAKTSDLMDSHVKEAAEMTLHPSNTNSQEGLRQKNMESQRQITGAPQRAHIREVQRRHTRKSMLRRRHRIIDKRDIRLSCKVKVRVGWMTAQFDSALLLQNKPVG